MDSHLLFKLTYVFYRIRSTILHGERWLVETSGKFRPFYSLCKGWFRDLAQCLFHNIVPYSFVRGTPTFPLVKILILIWKDSLGGVLERCLYTVSSSSLEETLELEGYCFCFAWRSCFFKSSISRCTTLSLPCSWTTWPFLQKPLPSVWTSCMLPSWWSSRSLWCSRLWSSSCWPTLADSAWCELVWCGPDPVIAVKLYWNTSNPHKRRQL